MAAKPTEEVKKSDGFAFPGDPSVNLRMTDCLFAVMLSVSETSPGRVVSRGVAVTVKLNPLHDCIPPLAKTVNKYVIAMDIELLKFT